MRDEQRFGELRSLLQSGAGTARGWGRLCELVEGFEPERFSAQVLPYVLAHRDRFPEHLRFIPRRWLQDEALWPLARIADALLVDLESAAWAAQYLAQQHEPHTTLLIVHLPLDDDIDDEALKRALGVELPDAPGLASVRRLYILPGKWSDANALSALLRSARLESLEEVVARGQVEGDWLPDALADHPKLRFVDISARATGRVDALPWSVRALALQHCSDELIESLSWFGAAAPSLEQLWLSQDGATTLAQMIEDVYHRLTGLNHLDVIAPALLTFLRHSPLRQAWRVGLKRLEVVSAPYVFDADEASLLSELEALEALGGAQFERWQDVVTLLTNNPGLRHLSLRGTWCVSMIQALEAQGLSDRISVMNMVQMKQEQLDALYAMDPSRWPMLRSITLGWDIEGELELSRVTILPRLESLCIRSTSAPPCTEASLAALIVDGELTSLNALSLDLPLSAELGALVCSASWPNLKALQLGVEGSSMLLPLLVANDTLARLRLLQLEAPGRFAATIQSQPALLELFEQDRLPSLEYIGFDGRLLAHVLRQNERRSEWLLTNRMMYWFYHRHPECLGLVDLFGAF